MFAKRSFFSFFLVLFLLSSFVLASEDYRSLGQNDFVLGRNYFNSVLPSFTTSTRAVTGYYVPLVADLDNDGENEIVVFDGGTVRLYSGHTLSIVDSYDGFLGSSVQVMAFNIDDDAFVELLVMNDNSANLSILQFNGTKFVLQKIFGLSSAFFGDNDQVFGCDAVAKKCLVFGSPGSSTGFLRAQAFNATHAGAVNQLTATGGQVRCQPRIKFMDVKDIDIDGVTEFVVSTILYTTGVDSLEVWSLSLNGLAVLYDDLYSQSLFAITDSASSCLSTNVGRYITAPLCDDWDDSYSNGLECVVGYMVDSNEFNMALLSSSLVLTDTYPSVEDADGELVSNVFKGTFFPDSPSNSFCVVGFRDDDETLDMMCASEVTGDFVNTLEYSISPVAYNLSAVFGSFALMSHSVQSEADLTDGVDLSELLTSYGTLRADYDSCNIFGDCDLVLLWQNPKQSSALLAVDAEKVGRDDLLALTSTNLWYFDDGFTNSAPFLDYYVNPCLNAVWKVNTSVEVRITPHDVDGDMVRAKAVLYFGESFAQESGWSALFSSGTTFSFPFVANNTISSGQISLSVEDDNNNSATDYLSFSVAGSGVEFGDCITEVFGEENVTEGAGIPSDVLNPNLANNSFRTALQNINSQFGLNLGLTVLWLVIMVVLAVSLWFAGASGQFGKNIDHRFIFGLIGFVEFLMLVIGAKLGFISAGLIVIIVVIALVVLGFWVRSWVTGAGQ